MRPDNAPICPIIESTSQYVFVTLRGGGLFVVDALQTPMRIVAEYDINTVHPNGCPLTADPHVSTNSTPGVGVIKVTKGGESGKFETIAPISNLDATNVERADVHAITLRLMQENSDDGEGGDD